jgi:crossover junction endodeoxyribonuclease RuvC
MRIIGIDPGTVITGIGIIDCITVNQRNDGPVKGIFYDTINLDSRESIPHRLKEIYENCLSIIRKYKPDEFAIETAFYGKNIQSTLKLGQARGVALIAAINCGLKIFEYSPREIKKSVTGNGASSKNHVQYMIRSILSLGDEQMLTDSSDALAVALCHYYLSKSNSLIHFPEKKRQNKNQSWKSFIENHPEKVLKR